MPKVVSQEHFSHQLRPELTSDDLPVSLALAGERSLLALRLESVESSRLLLVESRSRESSRLRCSRSREPSRLR